MNARRGRRRVWAVAVALVVLIAPAVVTWALFSDQAARAGGVIVTGNLKLDPDTTTGSAVSWVETTPAIAVSDRASGTSFSTLAAFRGVPGDTVEVRYAVSTTLAGDNISAVVTATLGAVLPTGVTTAGYRVLTPAGAVVAPATGTTALGTATVVPALRTAGTQRYLIAIQLSWTGTTATLVYTSTVTSVDAAVLTTLPVSIRLDQVRTGGGFTS